MWKNSEVGLSKTIIPAKIYENVVELNHDDIASTSNVSKSYQFLSESETETDLFANSSDEDPD